MSIGRVIDDRRNGRSPRVDAIGRVATATQPDATVVIEAPTTVYV